MKGVEGHLEYIRQNAADEAQELKVYKNIINPDDLILPEFVSIASAGEFALSLRSVANSPPALEQHTSSSPQGVVDLHGQITSQIEKKILALEASGVKPASDPEITPQVMASFMGNVSGYLFGCAASAIDALSANGKGVLEARSNPKNASLSEEFLNTAIDQALKGVVGGEGTASIATRIGYGAVGVYGGGGLNATTGTKPKTIA